MKAHIVLGTLFGDEGKGSMTNYLCSQSEKPLVIRFSGGHQAGHTVMIGEKKHIHSSFGSGTLAGHPSYFSEHTCMYPVNMMKEYKKLKSFDLSPELYIHPMAKVTTPYDVYANRTDRNNCNNGSCGLGIGKTMYRNEHTHYRMNVIDLFHPIIAREKLNSIESYYKNTGQLEKTTEFRHEMEHFKDIVFGDDYLNKVFYLGNLNTLSSTYEDLIFEGSQGILLDKDHGIFPNVTYANTTSKNALELLKSIPIMDNNIGIYYVLRSYLTRHGAGWFPKEVDLELINTEEEINVEREYQGRFKITNHVNFLIRQAIWYDNIYSEHLKKNIVLTCLDQRPNFSPDNLNSGWYGYNYLYTSDSPQGDFKRQKL